MLFKILQNINRNKFSPYVISLTSKEGYGDSIGSLNVPLYCLGMGSGLFSFFNCFKLFHVLINIQPNTVHTWMYHADLLGGLVAWFLRVPRIIWCIRHSDFSRSTTKLSTFFVMKMCSILSYLIPNNIICCSNRGLSIHKQNGYDETKLCVIPNGFDLVQFTPSLPSRLQIRKELDINDKSPVVGLIARFHPQKNHSGFFQAAKIIHKIQPEVLFVLVGKGVDLNNLKIRNYITEYNLDSVVHLLGLRHDISKVMASLDVLVSSSSHGEAFPNVIGEAMSCGVPCVVTDVGDSAEIVGDTGAVVRVGDMEELANRVLSIINMPSSKKANLVLKARDRVKKLYNIPNVVRLYENAYSSTNPTYPYI